MTLTIRITTNKNNRRIAYYYVSATRLHRISVAEAELAIARERLYNRPAVAE